METACFGRTGYLSATNGEIDFVENPVRLGFRVETLQVQEVYLMDKPHIYSSLLWTAL